MFSDIAVTLMLLSFSAGDLQQVGDVFIVASEDEVCNMIQWNSNVRSELRKMYDQTSVLLNASKGQESYPLLYNRLLQEMVKNARASS